MKSDEINTGLRMVGYLLEYNKCTGYIAKTRTGKHVSLDDPDACKWCFIGALDIVSQTLHIDYSQLYLAALRVTKKSYPLDAWEGPRTSKKTRLDIARKLQAV